MKKTILLILFLFVVVFLVAGLYFSRLNQNQNETKEDIAAIPADATLLLSFKNDSSVYDLFQDYKGFELLIGEEEFAAMKKLKEVFLNNSNFLAVTENQPVYISFHPEQEKTAWLVSMPLKADIDPLRLKQVLDSTLTISDLSSNQIHLYELTVPGIRQKIFGSFEPHRFSLSFSKTLLERSLDDKAERLSDLFLEKFQENNQLNNSPVQLYINHEPLKDFFDLYTERSNSMVELFEKLDGLTMLDINYKSDVLMFSGNSVVSTSDSSYLSLFKDQEPVSHQLKYWIPDNVAEISSYGISDFDRFHTGLGEIFEWRKEAGPLAEQIRYIESNTDVLVDDEFLPLWGSEFARLRLQSGSQIAIAAVRDSLEYSTVIEKLSTLSADSSYRRFDNSNLLYYALGDPMKDFKRPYFIYANGYAIIANSSEVLRDYMERIRNQELLMNSEDYLAYDKLQSSSSNFSLFIHQENARRSILQNLNEPFRKNYQDTRNYGYQNFYAFSLQLSGNGDRFSVNLYGKFEAE